MWATNDGKVVTRRKHGYEARVEVEDETDPHPYWLVSTRHGERLAPLLAGARQIQGTLNGIGERCGNANLISIIPTLMLKMGLDTGVPRDGLPRLADVSRLLDRRLNRASNRHAADVGDAIRHRRAQPADRCGGQERPVAEADQHLAAKVRQRRFCLKRGMAGAQLIELQDYFGTRSGQRRLDLLVPVAGDDHLPRHAQLAKARQQMQQHRPSADRVQHLGAPRLHAGALTGGEHDDGEEQADEATSVHRNRPE